MNESFDNYIIQDQINLTDRFENKPEVISKLSGLSREYESIIWERLMKDNFIGQYELLPGNFKHFESTEFADNYDKVNQKLNSFNDTNCRVILIWNSDIYPIVTDLATFTNNWDTFYCPSSDDLIVINEGWEWIAYFAHFECLYFGRGIINS